MSVSDTSSDSPDLGRVMDRLRRACSRREYCTSDIKRKLSLSGCAEYADKVITSLKEEGFLDDARYAIAYCRDKSGLSGWGAAKIRYFLSAKGIPGDLIDEALSMLDNASCAKRLDAIVAGKWSEITRRHPDVSRHERMARLLRFASGRGYSYAEIMDSVERNGFLE